jgi:hypothetical protein
MLEIKDARTEGYVNFADLPIGTVYEDLDGYIGIKVDDDKVFFNNEDGVWELIIISNEKALPLKAELVITGRK